MNALAVLVPPATKGHTSVVKLLDQWFVVCTSGELRKKPIQRVLQGVPLVLFRDAQGKANALLDRCPHRNVPLSGGSVEEGLLQCPYHGWRFDGGGECRVVPGLCEDAPTSSAARKAPSHAVAELDGYVWVYTTPDTTPVKEPFRFPHLEDRRYSVVRAHVPMPASLHACVENALDVPHTGFLHGGLFRTANKVNEITVRVHRKPDRVEAEYVGEPAPKGLAGRLLAPQGGTVEHWDRFIMPCVAQVEYSLGTGSNVVISTAFTPITDFETRAYTCVAIRLPIPAGPITPFIMPLAGVIFWQDARILRKQTAVIQGFGGEQYANTEIDVLGPHIWHLLRQAERGLTAAADSPILERRMKT